MMFNVPPADIGNTVLYVCAVLALVYAFCQILDRDRATDRWMFSAVGAFVTLDYFVWRVSTLPTPSYSVVAAWQWGFFACESVALLGTMISFLLLLRNSDYSGLADLGEERLRKLWQVSSDQLPGVDVLICTYNEELQILEKTIQTALAIDYPNYTVYVLDDTRRTWLKAYCDRVGAKYVTRLDNVGAKAGNLNNGLRYSAASTNSPFVLVLDADFCVDKRILLRILGLFDDEKVGVVQTPQFYYNADPIQHNLLGSKFWVDEQRLFFDIVEPAKDAWGTAFCVGTSFVVRRELLDRLGGYPQDSVAEDLYLSYRLMPLGYTTRWLNEKLSVGLSAEGVAEYVTQRARWCLGAIQLAYLEHGPVRGSGYTFSQRLHYWHGLLHWLGRPFILLMLVAPVVYWLGGVPAIQTDYVSFLQHGVPALFVSTAYSYWRYGGRVLPILTEVSQIIAAVPVTIQILSALRRPFGRPFKVTTKGGNRSSVTVHWQYAGMFGSIILLTLAGMISANFDEYAPTASDPGFLFNFAWGVFSMVLCLVAMLVSIDLPRRHVEEWFAFAEKSRLATGAGSIDCLIEAIGVDGALLRLNSLPQTRDLLRHGEIKLNVEAVGWIGAEVTSVNGEMIMLEFCHDDVTRPGLIRRIFSSAPVNTANVPSPFLAWKGILMRAVASPKEFDAAWSFPVTENRTNRQAPT